MQAAFEPGRWVRMEPTFGHIVLATDFSEESLAAFEAVRELVDRNAARLTVLHVVPALDDHPVGTPFVSPVELPTDAEQIDEARADLRELRHRFPGVRVSFDACAGNDTAEAICAYTEEQGADLIVVTTHGRRGLRRLVLGSVAEEVLRRTPVPVLVVPAN